jgi:hypothetical protein
MKISVLFRAKKYGSIKKILLLVFLIVVSLVIFQDVTWFYHNFETGLGSRVAQVAIAYHVVLLLAMVTAGVGLGHSVDRIICQKRSVFHSPMKGSWAEVLMNLWGYELKSEEAPKSEIDSEPKNVPGMFEPFVLLDLPTRRGRKPTFPLERWLPIAMQWENRDPIRDAFTLGELISEHLGTNADGSPIVSEQTYYSTWRPRAITELRRRTKPQKSTTLRKPENKLP